VRKKSEAVDGVALKQARAKLLGVQHQLGHGHTDKCVFARA
jgi:hypothetical protein